MADLIGDFLRQETPFDPKEYIRAAVEGTSGAWVPIHYFARKAGMDGPQLVACINASGGSATRRSTFVARARLKQTAFRAATSPAIAALLAALETGTPPEIADERGAARLASAVQGLHAMPTIPLPDLLGLLARCLELVRDAPSSMSMVRRAICRLDELAFAVSFSSEKPS